MNSRVPRKSAEKVADDGIDMGGANVGRAIRRLRKDVGMSLQDLARAADVSVGMLSEIERDAANPSLRILTQIRKALGVPVTALFEDVYSREPSFVRRADKRPRLRLGYFEKELLSSAASQNLQVMLLHIPPKGSSGEHPLSYASEKAGLVIDGEIHMRIGEEEAILRTGDSFEFDGNTPHSFRNPGNKPTRILWIIGAVPVDRHL